MNRPGRATIGLTAGCVLAALTVTGCATGGGAAGQVSTTPRSDLAVEAEVAARNAEQEPGLAKQGRDRAGKGDAARSRPAATPAPGSNETAAADSPAPVRGRTFDGPGWALLAAGVDARSDHGSGPGYADLTSVSVEEDGDRLQVTVELAATVPGALGVGEVQGVGLDVFRSSGRESDYQVFLDGGSDGWHGYLQTPQGFVGFPGSLRVTGSSLVVVLPWSAVGGREDARFWAFADWADGRGRSSADTLDLGSVRVD